MATKTTSTTDNNAGCSPCTPEAHQRTGLENQMTELFGDVIHAYTNAQALEDGYLIDITSTAREAGFTCPVAVSQAAWADCVEWMCVFRRT